jgi:hypothetical protein
MLTWHNVQGRGGTTGYDNAGALVGLEADGGEGQEELFKETNKVYQVRLRPLHYPPVSVASRTLC